MQNRTESADVVVVGGGFFGLRLALLARNLGRDVLLLERSDVLMGRASRYNQARVHTGYHYPRAFVTARRSAIGSRRFQSEYPEAIDESFVKLYAVAAAESRVTPVQFERLAEAIDAPLERDDGLRRGLFDPRHIAAVYRAREAAFDCELIRDQLVAEALDAGVEIRMQTIARYDPTRADLVLSDAVTQDERRLSFRNLVVATYGAFAHCGVPTKTRVDLQMTELCLVELPAAIAGYGVTVMDGPYFSCMPWPPAKRHSLSHVAFTPHRIYRSGMLADAYAPLEGYRETEFRRMLHASQRLMPALAGTTYCGSHFEVKALPEASAHVDSRPIVWEQLPGDPRVVSVLGSKLDTIYDAEEALRRFLETSGSVASATDIQGSLPTCA